MAIGPELQPYFTAFSDRLVAFAIDHDDPLAVDLHLILDALADEKGGLGYAADHALSLIHI